MRTRAWVGLLLACLLALVGCGGGSSSDVSTKSVPTTAGPGTAAPSAVGDAASFDPEDALLTLADMPTGWVQEPDSPDDDSGFCAIPSFDDDALDQAEAVFSKQGQVTQLTHGTAAFAPGGSGTAYRQVRDTMDGCGTGSYLGAEVTVERTLFPAYGDESAAYLVTVTPEPGRQFPAFFVFVRLGDGLIGVAYGDEGSVDEAAAQAYVAKAVRRMQAAQG
jgi:hypothetical protein